MLFTLNYNHKKLAKIFKKNEILITQWYENKIIAKILVKNIPLFTKQNNIISGA